MELLLPEVRPPALALPSYVKLDMAFGVGAGGQLFDKSRYRSHGAINGPDWAAGLHGYSLDFVPATLDHVLIPALFTQLNFTSEDFSIIMRVNFDALATNTYPFIRGLYHADGYYIKVTITGNLEGWTSQTPVSQRTYTGVGVITTGVWTTIGLSRSGDSIIVYKNGVAPAQTAGVHIDPDTCARSAKIGIDDDLITDPLDGKIEFLRIFGGIALTASEHLAWHRALA